MATPRMDITSFVGKLLEEDDVDLLREGVRVLAQALMETEVSSQIGAAPYERSSGRTAYRVQADGPLEVAVCGARRTPGPHVAPTGSDASISDQTAAAAAGSY